MKKHKKPKKFDYNLIVIGGGSAGLVASYIAATLKAKVALVEKNKMGGDCLNTGCVPSKALIRSAKILSYAKRAHEFGLKEMTADFEFSNIMDRVHKIIKKIEPHDSVERYSQLGVDCIQGEAYLQSPYQVEVNGKTYTTRALVVATGASPLLPPLPGLKEVPYLTSDTLWELRDLPKNLLVLGGGPIGLELAQCFTRFGSKVTLIEKAPQLLPREDLDVSKIITKKVKEEGLRLLLGHTALSFEKKESQYFLTSEKDGHKEETPFDQVLIALGRKANVSGFGLENLGVQLSSKKTIEVNSFLSTNIPNIYVCGDVAGPFQFTHIASHQAYYACVNALFHPISRWVPPPWNRSLKVNYSVIPWATYTDPEVATVGLTEKMAQEKNIPYELTTYGIDDLDRAIADSEDRGLVKVLTVPGKDQILGATIVASHASDMVNEFIAAMKNGFGLNSILGTIHIYPTLSEANKFAAGQWKKARKPDKLLNSLKKFHQWRLS